MFRSLLVMGILTDILALLGFKPQEPSQMSSNNSAGIGARQVRIDGLTGVLTQLSEGRTEFDFVGITSNGIDCLYFVRDGETFDVEFEAMFDDQIPYIEKLKTFAESDGYQTLMTTYGNKPRNGSLQEAPVIRIETNSDLTTTARIGAEIQKSVFGNSEDTTYDVVP